MSTYLVRGKVGYLIMTALCIILAMIYEDKGHGIFSWHIRLLFLIPLFMYILFFVLGLVKNRHVNMEYFLPGLTFLRLFAASETARHAFIGIVRVYGTVSSKMYIFYGTSALFLVASAVCFIHGTNKYFANKKKFEGDRK